MRVVYTLLLYVLTPFLVALLLAKGWRARLPERFGLVRDEPAGTDAWLHAASVGEVLAARPLVEALLARGSLVVTTNTPTGSARVQAEFGGRVRHCYAPLDLPGCVSRFLQRARPRLAVVMETELWPNRFAALAARGVPLLIANARLSPRSMPRYRRLRALTAPTLRACAHIAAQTPPDAQRFVDLGAPASRVSVMGNLKYETVVPDALAARGRELRQRLGRQRPAWIAASTREGEEEQVLAAHREVLRRHPGALLILVPRHPQRFDAVARLVEDAGLRGRRRSALDGAPIEADVLLGDSVGEMFMYYAAADVAFVGGTLVPLGGQNVLEAAAMELPVLFGPSMFNFAEPRERLLAAGAAAEIRDAPDLAQQVAALLGDAARRRRMGDAGAGVIAANRGALHRFVQLLPAAARGEPSSVSRPIPSS